MKAELERRASNTGKVLALFQSRPLQWIDVHELATVGGFAAWRTRVADARAIVQQDGGNIEWNGQIRTSAYRYVPYTRLGRDASVPVTQDSLF